MFFARGVKKHRVLRCFVAFGVAEIYLGTIKKPRVLRGFRVPGRHRKEKKDTLKEFQHSLAELVDLMGQDRVKIGPRWGQDRANLGEDRANLGQHRANLGEDRVNIGAR